MSVTKIDMDAIFYRQGEKSFFLMPGEKLEKGIQNVYILGEDEGLILKASESFLEGVSYTFCIYFNINNYFIIFTM